MSLAHLSGYFNAWLRKGDSLRAGRASNRRARVVQKVQLHGEPRKLALKLILCKLIWPTIHTYSNTFLQCVQKRA